MNSPMLDPGESASLWPGRELTIRSLPGSAERAYVRFVALGDSATYGVGDVVDGRPRGWSRVLAEAIAHDHDLSFCNLAVLGATTEDVWLVQLGEAVDHRPNMASLIVGLNDTLRPDWDRKAVRERLLRTADELAWCGAALLTVTFHDHARVFGLPRILARPLSRRIDQLNEIYQQVHLDYDSIHVDLRTETAVYQRAFWTADRLHPSELGHRWIAHRFAEELEARGLGFASPNLSWTGGAGSKVDQLRSLVSVGIPWLGRRVEAWAAGSALHPTWTRISQGADDGRVR